MEIVAFKPEYQLKVSKFFDECFRQLGREYYPSSRHKSTSDIEGFYMKKGGGCWCLMEKGIIYGTVAVNALGRDVCELKMMYLMPSLHGSGWAQELLDMALTYARYKGYQRMMLDSLKENQRAISFYKRNGFNETERYNQNIYAEIFMEKRL